jgi:hypothetical protein
MSMAIESVPVAALKDQNSKSKVFKKRNGMLKSKVKLMRTAASAPKIDAGPSPAMTGKAYWRYMKKVLTDEEFAEAKKEHQHQRYLAEKLAKGGCVNNGLPSPSSLPKIVAGPSPAVIGKAYWKYMGTVLTEEELKEAKTEHRHHKRHQQYLEKFPDSSSSPMSISKAFWKRIKQGLTEEEFAEKRRVINQKRRLTKKVSGSVLRFEREPSTTSPDFRLGFVPALVIRTMSPHHIGCLQDLEQKLAKVLPLSQGVKSGHSKAGNKGYNLGLTVAPGGIYGSRAKGISGSIHRNPHLKRHPKLQEEVIELVIDIILEYYSGESWFIELMRCLGDIPDKAFLPGSRRAPVSAIWWSHSPEAFHVHCDNNSLGAIFIFAAVAAPGCELVIDRPFGDGYQITKRHLSEGKIIGGSWGQYSHCNLPVLDSTIPRRSFVVYLDYRTICTSYRNMVD